MTSSVRYRVSHTTFYDYDHPIGSGRHLAHLSPRETAWQRVESHTIVINPPANEQSDGIDYFGNPVVRFAHDSPHRTLRVQAESLVAVNSQTGDWTATPWEPLTRDGASILHADDPALTEFRLASPHVPIVAAAAAYVRASFPAARPLPEALTHLCGRMRREFAYDPLATTIATPVADVARNRRGVCQDFAHFLLSGLRGLGFAARYVSGYIVNVRAKDAAPDTTDAVQGADSSHAWVAVHAGGDAWIGCDPTNGKLADTEFVTLGWGRDFGDVTPLRGVVLGAGTRAPEVAVRVDRL
ncbi:MAG: transglutaminase N-terminal domain-containing protein [Gammaproteobacteria bacterium]